MCTYINVLVTLQVPSLSPGAQRAGKGKVEYPPCSTSKLKIVFGILPWIFRVKEEKISTSITLLENKSQEASKAKRCFWGWCLASMGPCQVPCWVLTGSSQRLASCPHLSFCHAQGDKQQQAGLKGDFLHSAAKTIISSCFPATCQKWFIGTGMGQTGGRHQWSQSLLLIRAALFPSFLEELCSAGCGQSLLMCVWLFCAHQKGDDCQNLPWMDVYQLLLGYTLEYSMLKQWWVACGTRKVYFC